MSAFLQHRVLAELESAGRALRRAASALATSDLKNDQELKTRIADAYAVIDDVFVRSVQMTQAITAALGPGKHFRPTIIDDASEKPWWAL